MRKVFLIVTACLMACLTQNARAYEYTFDLEQKGQNEYQAVESYESGITIYIHTNGDQAPNLHAWNANGPITTWPGVKMTELVAVNVKGDDNNKKGYYRMHFDVSEMAFVVNFNGDNDKTTDTYINAEGSYFFDYNGEGGSTLKLDKKYYEQSSSQTDNNINLYVRVLGDGMTPIDDVPYMYFWSGYDTDPNRWNQDWAHEAFTDKTTISGSEWWKKSFDKTKVQDSWDGQNKGGIILTLRTGDYGNYQYPCQTPDIKDLTPGDYYIYYHPYGSDKRYEMICMDFGGHTNNYDECIFNPFWTVDGSIVTITTENEHGTATIKMQCTSPEEASRVKFVDGKYLLVPRNTTFTGTQGDENALNEMYLGPLPESVGGQDVVQFGTEVGGIVDYLGIGDKDNYFIAGMNGIDAGTTSISCTIPGDYQDTYLGPKMMIRDEYISSEDLTFSDHNTMGQNFELNDDLVGVQVVEIGTDTKKSYLICRSLNPISDAHKHKKQDNQEIWVNTKGVTPAYANPATPQYAWIGLEISDPEQYINKTISNVRGIYYPDALNGQAPNASFGGTSEFYNYKMFNPIFKVVGAPVCGTETVATTINTYCTANLCEQDGKQYFFMEPRPFEIANIVDVMRTDDQVLWVPTEDAILPDGQTVNEYAEYGITGWAAIIDRSYDMWEESDIELFGPDAAGWAWRLRDKVYDVPEALILLATYHPNNNPLDQPNREYYGWSSNLALGYHIQGKAQIREYKEDMVVGKGDYWSRYEYNLNKNAYRNDLEITIYKPNLNIATIGNMIVQRVDKDENAVNIANLTQQGNSSTFVLSYIDDTQDARNDAKLAEIVNEKPVYKAGNYDLQDGNIGISDMFYSSSMDCRVSNAALTDGYVYRVVPAPGNNNTNLSCVEVVAPVYKTNENVVTRATYTKEDVDNDINNKLVQRDVAEITFIPNMDRATTQYRVYWAQQNASEGTLFKSVDAADIQTDDAGFLTNPTIEDNITGETKEYVPELYTAYNNNTYGCYKQSVSDASVEMNVKSIVAADFTNDENGTRYIHAAIDLSSVINNTDKDSRYLLRVWRQVGNSEKVLLNDQEEAWETNYKALRYLGMDEDKFSKTNPSQPFTLYDTFEASTTTNAAHGLKAEGETVNIEDVTYYATLYVKDDASGKYYVKQSEGLKLNTTIPTAISTIAGSAQVESVRYINVAGMESDKPFAGMNIVVTRYSNGTTTITKMIK